MKKIFLATIATIVLCGATNAKEPPWIVTCTQAATAKYLHGSVDDIQYMNNVVIPKCYWQEDFLQHVWMNALMHGNCKGLTPIECARYLSIK